MGLCNGFYSIFYNVPGYRTPGWIKTANDPTWKRKSLHSALEFPAQRNAIGPWGANKPRCGLISVLCAVGRAEDVVGIDLICRVLDAEANAVAVVGLPMHIGLISPGTETRNLRWPSRRSASWEIMR